MGKTFQLSSVITLLLTLAACSGEDVGAGAAPTGMSQAGASSGDTTTPTGGNAPSAGTAGSGGGAGKGGGVGTMTEVPGKPGQVNGCTMFPEGDDWNLDISTFAMDPTLTKTVQELVGTAKLHPDYGVDGQDLYGIPINAVPQNQMLEAVTFDWYPDESDAGPYPFPGPDSVIIEGNRPESCDGDCHLLVVQGGTCMLFEGYACEHRIDGWHCGNGAKWNLNELSYGQRPVGWTSADAAGLPIAPGILRYEEVRAGEVTHALRFTLDCTTDKYVKPATHQAVPEGCDASKGPPMGTRVRLKADYDTSKLSPSAQVVLSGMKKYGMILADNGSNFFFQGQANAGWTEADIEPLKSVPASAFEVVASR